MSVHAWTCNKAGTDGRHGQPASGGLAAAPVLTGNDCMAWSQRKLKHPNSPQQLRAIVLALRISEHDMDLLEFFGKVQHRVDACLKARLARLPAEPAELKEAMEYALLLGGKRARPLLVYASGRACGASWEDLDYVAAAIECIHSYSLIHDDMPEMDNDMLRRGHPTVHAKYGAAAALLAGDTLQALAFDLLTDSNCRLAPDVKGRMCACLARASGFEGMCGGQAIDLASEHKKLPQDQLEKLHSLKTGALITCAVQLGFMAGRYQEAWENRQSDAIASAVGLVESNHMNREFECLTEYGRKVGLAFQVWDDVLDVAGDTAVMGKNAGSDESLEKSTYVTLMGLDAARAYAKQLADEAQAVLKKLSVDTDILSQFAQFCVTRDH